ncbi:hypothetical protein BH09PSE2_BH09PSE2_22120 [soil metagenome]
MKFRSLVLLACALGVGVAELPCFATPSWATTYRGSPDIVERGAGFRLHYTEAARPDVAAYRKFLAAGVATNQAFFAVRYPKPFDVYVYDNRAALDAGRRLAFKDPSYASPCWLAAIGVAHGVYMLAPVRWEEETCEGRYTTYADKTKTKRLFTHELTHVLNGQILRAHGRDDGDDIAWFREGLAMLVAGQLGPIERREVQAALKAGAVPSSLKAISELPNVGLRYNIMGSLALSIDRTFGREKLKALMDVNSQTAVLSSLGQSEQAFLTSWRRFAADGAFAASAAATGHS